MSANADMYSAFLLDGTIDQYRATYIDPFSVEIEHLGMNACFDAILKPAGIAVDISYLDRTEGDKVNTFTWPTGSPDAPTLRMLYRP